MGHIKGGDGEDVDMEPEEGWKPEYMQWWFEFLNRKKVKGISKDTWNMVCSQLSLAGRRAHQILEFFFFSSSTLFGPSTLHLRITTWKVCDLTIVSGNTLILFQRHGRPQLTISSSL